MSSGAERGRPRRCGAIQRRSASRRCGDSTGSRTGRPSSTRRFAAALAGEHGAKARQTRQSWLSGSGTCAASISCAARASARALLWWTAMPLAPFRRGGHTVASDVAAARRRRHRTACTPGLIRRRGDTGWSEAGEARVGPGPAGCQHGVRRGRQSPSPSSGRDLSRWLPRLVSGSGWDGRQTRTHPDPLYFSLVVSLLLLSMQQLLHRRKLAFQCFVVHPESSRGRR